MCHSWEKKEIRNFSWRQWRIQWGWSWEGGYRAAAPLHKAKFKNILRHSDVKV
jgi:hypothetical protein